MNSRNSIRGIAVTTGTAVAGVAVAAGLNVTGALGDATASDDFAERGQDDARRPPRPAHTTLVQTKTHVAEAHRARRRPRHAKKVRKERAAKAAAAARAAREAASRSSTRTYSGDPRGIARSMMAVALRLGRRPVQLPELVVEP